MLIFWILGFSIFGSIGAIAGAALLLALPAVIRGKLVPYLISYATGTLLAAAFLGMMPAALQQAPAREVLATVLAGIILFSSSKNSSCGGTVMTVTVRFMARPPH